MARDLEARLSLDRFRRPRGLVAGAMAQRAGTERCNHCSRTGRHAGWLRHHRRFRLSRSVVVAPDHWGSPLATMLVDEAKRLSPDGVTLKVNADNNRAIRFYERSGFVHMGEE